MRLVDLDPKWINRGDRTGIGIRFNDPNSNGAKGAFRVYFSNPTDGGPPLYTGNLWRREGNDFESLTLSPSINGEPGLSHFNVSNGNITF